MAYMFTRSGPGDPGRSTRRLGALLIAGLLIVASAFGVSAVSAAVPGASPSPSASPTLPATLVSIVLAPASATIAVNGSQSYTAEGYDVNGVDLGDVTWATQFTISGLATGLGS